MQLSQTVRYFWQFLAIYSIAALIISLIQAVVFGWLIGLVAFGIFLLLFVGILTTCQPLFVPYQVKHWQVEPVSLLDWPTHDFSELDDRTAELAELGFQPLQDYAQPQRQPVQPIARCFANPYIGSFAEIGLCLGPTEPDKPQSTVATPTGDTPIAAISPTLPKPQITYTVFLTVFDHGWILIDGNFAPHPGESLIYAWRNPREVRYYYPNLSSTQLLDRHLSHRQAMMHRLNLQCKTPMSWDIYREIQRELITQPWRRLRRRNLLMAMLDATQFEQNPAHEWLGEYRQVLRQDIHQV